MGKPFAGLRYKLGLGWPHGWASVRPVRLGLALLLTVFMGANAVDALPISDPVERTARPYVFDLISWEAWQATVHAPRIIGNLWTSGGEQSDAEERQVLDYFLLTREIREADQSVRRLQAEGAAAGDIAAAQQTLNALQARRAQKAGNVEALLGKHTVQELRRDGITTDLGPLRTLFPPVEFTMTHLPSVLVVSPRNKIMLQHSIVLRPELTPEEIERIERTIEAQGLSTIVEPTGGFSTYPAMIPDTSNLDFTTSTVVHEWLHAYLFFRPLGWNYFDSNEMRSINETVADIGGKEIGERLAARYRRHLPPAPPAPGTESATQQGKADPPPFDFNKTMRETRLEADRLLAEGLIDEAEQYLEAQRKVFVSHGYLIRKLNQAYFAFHGTYGDSPASVSPIYGYLQALRHRSPALADFLRTVSGIRRYEDLLALVSGGGPPQPGG